MKNIPVLFFAFMMFLYCSACSRPSGSTPVVVHVFRDPSAGKIDVAIQAIRQKRLTTGDNRKIIIATLESKTYREGLAVLGKEAHPDVVVLDSDDDSKLIERSSLRPIRTATSHYYIGIGPWSAEEQRDAAEQVISALSAALGTNER